MFRDVILEKTAFLFGEEKGGALAEELIALTGKYRALQLSPVEALSEKDAMLIVYPGQFYNQNATPLACLREFADTFLKNDIPFIHLLPFYPYTSDDGFSISDYRAVKLDHGTWDDIARLAEGWRLMFDFVPNHVSSSHPWFQGYLKGEPEYANYFIEGDPADPRLAMVMRPRTHPLLTAFETARGVKHLWTTFSTDQIDVNFAEPKVFREVVDTMLFYIARGATLIRLDAVNFIWKKLGTRCVHLPETHAAIQILRAVADEAAPGTVIITENNVPHHENISYFGNGRNEAGMVYQFTLPPLVLHSFITGDATRLSDWAGTIQPPSEKATYFNFLASHDGIGVTPVNGILSPEEIDVMLAAVRDRGGRISYRTDPDGSEAPYEMNISFLSALSPESDSPVLAARKITAAFAIAMAMPGIPGIYIHSLVGSRNWQQGLDERGYNRAINREPLDYAKTAGELTHPSSPRRLVYDSLIALLRRRAVEKAFNPNASFRVLPVDKRVFIALRRWKDDAPILSCVNISPEPVVFSIDAAALGGSYSAATPLTGEGGTFETGTLRVRLEPYGVLWLKLE